MRPPASHPVLSPAEARRLEEAILAGDESAEWAAMRRAGRAVGESVLRDSKEAGGFPEAGRLLVLVGKGHNGGDALIAAQTILEARSGATAEVVFVFGSRVLRPLAARAWREARASDGRIDIISLRLIGRALDRDEQREIGLEADQPVGPARRLVEVGDPGLGRGVRVDGEARPAGEDRKSTRLNSSHVKRSRMPSSA